MNMGIVCCKDCEFWNEDKQLLSVRYCDKYRWEISPCDPPCEEFKLGRGEEEG